eukprot:303099-Pleurochrysis_carterae.AAC.6
MSSSPISAILPHDPYSSCTALDTYTLYLRYCILRNYLPTYPVCHYLPDASLGFDYGSSWSRTFVGMSGKSIVIQLHSGSTRLRSPTLRSTHARYRAASLAGRRPVCMSRLGTRALAS